MHNKSMNCQKLFLNTHFSVLHNLTCRKLQKFTIRIVQTNRFLKKKYLLNIFTN
jgi:hypothetical protein